MTRHSRERYSCQTLQPLSPQTLHTQSGSQTLTRQTATQTLKPPATHTLKPCSHPPPIPSNPALISTSHTQKQEE